MLTSLNLASYPVLLGMMQFAEADPTQTDKIVGSMLKFVQLAHDMLANNATGLEEWGAARYQDFALVVQWCVALWAAASPT